MPIIKARPNRVRTLRHICWLQEPNRDALVLYARFIGDTPDYVLNQLIETTIAKDRESWRGAPSTSRRTRRSARVGLRSRRSRAVRPGRAEPPTMHTLIEFRVVMSFGGSAVAGSAGLNCYPFPAGHPILAMVRLEQPTVYAGFTYTYAVLWFTTPFFLSSMGFSWIYIFVMRRDVKRSSELPPYPAPEHRQDLFLTLGEVHHRTTPARATEPTWLTIPERGLYTGLFIAGAIGSGKASARMYPYVELLAYRAGDTARKVAGLVLEVKGDFCRQVREILARHDRADDYIEVSLESPYRYNPLHHDLDAYALAYGIATLMTNLFGRGREPFWQQASTNLVKLVILLHQVLDDYVTLVQVYEHVINPDKLRARIVEGQRRFGPNRRRILVDKREHLLTGALAAWRWQDEPARNDTSTVWTADLEEVLKRKRFRAGL